jgi:uncharacterized protein
MAMLDIIVAVPQRTLTALVRAYRFLLSPWLGSSCRFTPSCSSYSLQALESFGAVAGAYLTLRRLGRCHPWCEGGVDRVPEFAPRLFRPVADRQSSCRAQRNVSCGKGST